MSCVFVSIQLCDKIVFDYNEVGYSLYFVQWIHFIFYLLWISIIFCAKHEYIGSFELNWICIVFCQMDGFIESFNRNNRISIVFHCLLDV
jgi:hypothetical protein